MLRLVRLFVNRVLIVQAVHDETVQDDPTEGVRRDQQHQARCVMLLTATNMFAFLTRLREQLAKSDSLVVCSPSLVVW